VKKSSAKKRGELGIVGCIPEVTTSGGVSDHGIPFARALDYGK
jgi:hypothetical protein